MLLTSRQNNPNVLIDDLESIYKDGRAEVVLAPKHTDRNPQATIQALEKIYNNLEEHGFANVYILKQ